MARLQQSLDLPRVQTDQEPGYALGLGTRLPSAADDRHLGARLLFGLQKPKTHLPKGNVENHQLEKSCR